MSIILRTLSCSIVSGLHCWKLNVTCRLMMMLLGQRITAITELPVVMMMKRQIRGGWQCCVRDGILFTGHQVFYISDPPTFHGSICINPTRGNRSPTPPQFIALYVENHWPEASVLALPQSIAWYVDNTGLKVSVLALLQSIAWYVENTCLPVSFFWLSHAP